MQKKNALLVYPKFPDTFWSFKHALPFVGKQAALPPLGLATIAAILPKEWRLQLVDLNIREISEKELQWADYVLISAMTVQRDSAKAVIERAKKADKIVIVGGPLFTSEYESFLDSGVDHFVLNEAEITLPEFLADLEQGNVRRVYQSDRFSNMEETPTPRWELLDLKVYHSMAIQWSRGCPYQCDFCQVTELFGHLPRTKTSVQVIAELQALWTAGWRGEIFFVDDNLIGNKKRLKEDLLPALISWQEEKKNCAPFYTQVSINLAQDPKLMEMMAQAGFNMVFIGIETIDKEALLASGKTQNVKRDLVADVHTIQRAGFQVQAGLIVGFDNDTPNIFAQQIQFITQSKIVTAMVGILSAPPGTKLWKRLQQEGRIQGETSGDNVDGQTNIVPIMDMKLLQNGYKLIMQHIYSSHNYYGRIRKFLKVYKTPKSHSQISFQHFLAFFRAGWHLGICDIKGSPHYWFTLLWTLIQKPKLFPLVVGFAINGYHFRRVIKDHIH